MAAAGRDWSKIEQRKSGIQNGKQRGKGMPARPAAGLAQPQLAVLLHRGILRAQNCGCGMLPGGTILQRTGAWVPAFSVTVESHMSKLRIASTWRGRALRTQCIWSERACVGHRCVSHQAHASCQVWQLGRHDGVRALASPGPASTRGAYTQRTLCPAFQCKATVAPTSISTRMSSCTSRATSTCTAPGA